MKYTLQLRNGAVIQFDSYQILRNGIAYKKDTLEVYMTEDQYFPTSLKRVLRAKL